MDIEEVDLSSWVIIDTESATNSDDEIEHIEFADIINKPRLKKKLESIKESIQKFEKIIHKLECFMEGLRPNVWPVATNMNNSIWLIALTHKSHISTLRRLCGSVNQIKLKIKTIIRYLKENKTIL